MNKITFITFITFILFSFNFVNAVIDVSKTNINPFGVYINPPTSTTTSTTNNSAYDYNQSTASFNQYGQFWYNQTSDLSKFIINDSNVNLTTLKVQKNFSINSNTFVIASEVNKIGVGTNNPSMKLDVRGHGNFSGNLYVANNTLVNQWLYNQTNKGGWNWSGNYIYQNDLGDNVGIGTTVPEDLLNVYGGQLKINDTVGSTGSHELDSSILVQRGVSGTFLGARLTGGSNRFFMYMDTGNVYYRTFGTDSLKFGVDNSDDLTIITGGNVGIGTTTPIYPLMVTSNASSISIWASSNVSATGYITRTSVYDLTQGSALSKIKDASEYLNPDGTINHQLFYGYTPYLTTDLSRPEEQIVTEKECNTQKVEVACIDLCYDIDGNETPCPPCYEEQETCKDVERTITTYPYTKREEGVELGKEIDVLRQGVYELKIENQQLKSELCLRDKTYNFCNGII